MKQFFYVILAIILLGCFSEQKAPQKPEIDGIIDSKTYNEVLISIKNQKKDVIYTAEIDRKSISLNTIYSEEGEHELKVSARYEDSYKTSDSVVKFYIEKDNQKTISKNSMTDEISGVENNKLYKMEVIPNINQKKGYKYNMYIDDEPIISGTSYFKIGRHQLKLKIIGNNFIETKEMVFFQELPIDDIKLTVDLKEDSSLPLVIDVIPTSSAIYAAKIDSEPYILGTKYFVEGSHVLEVCAKITINGEVFEKVLYQPFVVSKSTLKVSDALTVQTKRVSTEAALKETDVVISGLKESEISKSGFSINVNKIANYKYIAYIDNQLYTLGKLYNNIGNHKFKIELYSSEKLVYTKEVNFRIVDSSYVIQKVRIFNQFNEIQKFQIGATVLGNIPKNYTSDYVNINSEYHTIKGFLPSISKNCESWIDYTGILEEKKWMITVNADKTLDLKEEK